MQITEVSISRGLVFWSKSRCWIPSCTIVDTNCTGLLPFAALDTLFPSVSAYIDSTIGKTVVKIYYLKVNWYVCKNRKIPCTKSKCLTVVYMKHIVIFYTLTTCQDIMLRSWTLAVTNWVTELMSVLRGKNCSLQRSHQLSPFSHLYFISFWKINAANLYSLNDDGLF